MARIQLKTLCGCSQIVETYHKEDELPLTWLVPLKSSFVDKINSPDTVEPCKTFNREFRPIGFFTGEDQRRIYTYEEVSKE